MLGKHVLYCGASGNGQAAKVGHLLDNLSLVAHTTAVVCESCNAGDIGVWESFAGVLTLCQ